MSMNINKFIEFNSKNNLSYFCFFENLAILINIQELFNFQIIK